MMDFVSSQSAETHAFPGREKGPQTGEENRGRKRSREARKKKEGRVAPKTEREAIGEGRDAPKTGRGATEEKKKLHQRQERSRKGRKEAGKPGRIAEEG